MKISEKTDVNLLAEIENLKIENSELKNKLNQYKTEIDETGIIEKIRKETGKPKILLVDDIDDNLLVLKYTCLH